MSRESYNTTINYFGNTSQKTGFDPYEDESRKKSIFYYLFEQPLKYIVYVFFRYLRYWVILLTILSILALVGFNKDAFLEKTSEIFSAFVSGNFMDSYEKTKELIKKPYIFREFKYKVLGKHPSFKELVDEYEIDPKDVVYIGNGKVITRNVGIQKYRDLECSSGCDEVLSFADQDDADDFCEDYFDGRLPSYEELEAALKLGSSDFHVIDNRKFAEWTSTPLKEDGDYFKVYFKSSAVKEVLEAAIDKEEREGLYYDEDTQHDKLSFRCIRNVSDENY